jgi:hypothetical protein
MSMGPDSTHDEVSDELTEAQQLDVGGGAGARCVDTVMGIYIHHSTRNWSGDHQPCLV